LQNIERGQAADETGLNKAQKTGQIGCKNIGKQINVYYPL
jgi:hypothetical protein